MTALEKLRGEVETLKRSVGNAKWWGHLYRAEAIEVHVRHLDSALKAVEDEARWVPIEERLPDEGKVVEVWYEGCFAQSRWLNDHWEHLTWRNVTHWRPRPTPPDGAKVYALPEPPMTPVNIDETIFQELLEALKWYREYVSYCGLYSRIMVEDDACRALMQDGGLRAEKVLKKVRLGE